MPKTSVNQPKKQSNQYDKIFKENLEVTLPIIVRDILGLQIVQSEEIPDDIQHTKERKPDALKKVVDVDGNTYILHVEFQVEDEQEMVYRMAEYSIMLMRKYKLETKQFVIYLREKYPTMPVHIETKRFRYSYELVCLSKVNYHLFLKSDIPEIQMLAILANLGKGDRYAAIRNIVEKIQANTFGDFSTSINFKQLRIFVQLRDSLTPLFEQVMQTVSKFFKEERDYLYRRGEAKGEAKGEVKGEIKGKREVIENLITAFGFSNEQAAKAAEVTVDFVEKVRISLNKKNNK